MNAAHGVLNGVSYQSTAHTLIKINNPILARISWIYGYLHCLILLYKENKKKHTDVIIQASSKSSIIPLVYFFTRITKTKFILENSEYPWFILKSKRKISNLMYRLIYLHVYYRMFDGVLAMTKALCRYHQRYSKHSAHILHLPMTVDMKRFELNCRRLNYITYIGNNSFSKDGVGILVDSFFKLSSRFPDWKLRIIGDTGNDIAIKRHCLDIGLSDKVELLGNVHRDSVPELLCQSKVLALARPSNLQSEGGFPTKLGEYLATGNLVVVTSVGEIPDYLEDHFSALIAQPDSVASFTEKLQYAISRYHELDFIGTNGKRVCREVFNADVQGKVLSEYLDSLVQN